MTIRRTSIHGLISICTASIALLLGFAGALLFVGAFARGASAGGTTILAVCGAIVLAAAGALAFIARITYESWRRFKDGHDAPPHV